MLWSITGEKEEAVYAGTKAKIFFN